MIESLLVAEDVFNLYISVALMLLALPNIIVVVILLNKKSRTFSMSAYMVSLSVADLIAVSKRMVAFKNYFVPITGIHECYLQSILSIGSYISPWTQAIISLERALSILKPHKIKLICSFQKAMKIIALTWIVALCIAVYSLVASEYKEESYSACYIKDSYVAVYNVAIWFLYVSVLPFPVAVIFISSCVLVVSLSMRKSVTDSKKVKLTGRRITIIVLILNGIFLVCNTPYTIHHALYILTAGEDDNLYHASISNIFRTMQVANNSLNVYVYFLAGSKFRQETKDLFIKLMKCK